MKLPTLTYKLLLTGIIVIALFLRIIIFTQVGGDHSTYKNAIRDFTSGINPYKYTVASYLDSGKDMEHGYAYMPTLLYILTVCWYISNLLPVVIPSSIFFKIPVLIADLLIARELYLQLKDKGKILAVLAVALWFFNPHFLARYEYTGYDNFLILSLLYTFKYLGKSDLLSGLALGIATTLKTVPIIFFPICFLLVTDKKKFISSFIFVLIAVSVPFMRNADDFNTYVQGALLVHGERTLQGRPFISFIAGSLGTTAFQNEFIRIYSFLALAIGPAVSLLLYKFKNIKDIYQHALVITASYILLTPVLSRTHLIWIIPLISLGLIGFMSRRWFVVSSVIVQVTLFFYLLAWNKGISPSANFGDPIKVPYSKDMYTLKIVEKLRAVRRGRIF